MKLLLRIYSYQISNIKYTPKIDFLRWLFYVQLHPKFKLHLGRFLIYLFNNPQLPAKYTWSYTKTLHALYILFTKDTFRVLTEYPEMFLRKAMFCNTVTFWLFVFFYRLFMGLEIQPKKKPNLFFFNLYHFLTKKVLQIYSNHRVSLKTRQTLYNFLNEDFYKSFFFVKRFKRLNDLIWQDGFLIDFLQKKVIDK